MSNLAQVLAQQARDYSLVEAVAVFAAMLYLLLAIRQNIWCWLCAAISAALYVYLFVVAKLYMQSVLNVFYFGMAIYGWQAWYYGRSDGDGLPVSSWKLARHVRAIAAISVVSLANGYLLDIWTDAEFPYIDSCITWGAIWATFLVARKVLENWWYWLLIDAASVAIYWLRDLQLTALLFVVYLVMIPFGLISWTRSRRAAGT
ncbi:MAG: nicotinamide riboside transporter PnuC [Gammaproteobacteria bacterium]|nr:nicotinamide riboside transporter PnuC [Gammaproteobacteria bacterium]